MIATALVLGGGGVTGIAWETGLLHGLAELGIDLTDAATVVGTSAGSVVGAQITSGSTLDDLYEHQLAAPKPAPLASLGLRVKLGFALAFVLSRGDEQRLGRRLGAFATRATTAGRTPTVGERLRAIEDRLPSLDWPDRDLRVTAVDAESGAFRVFRAVDGLPLRDVVAASCAVPGVYPPVPIGGRRYVDGGARTGANVDVARGCDRLVALTPMARVVPRLPSAREQAQALGVPHVVVAPDDAALAAIGANVLDPAARAAAARAGRAQAAAVADEIRTIWSP